MIINTKIRDAHKLLLYTKYANYYRVEQDECVLIDMIRRSRALNETSCLLFEEFSNDEYGVSADDLEDVFERGIPDTHLSIQEIIEGQIKHYRHILKLRVAHTIDSLEPRVSVQYILVWKKG